MKITVVTDKVTSQSPDVERGDAKAIAALKRFGAAATVDTGNGGGRVSVLLSDPSKLGEVTTALREAGVRGSFGSARVELTAAAIQELVEKALPSLQSDVAAFGARFGFTATIDQIYVHNGYFTVYVNADPPPRLGEVSSKDLRAQLERTLRGAGGLTGENARGTNLDDVVFAGAYLTQVMPSGLGGGVHSNSF